MAFDILVMNIRDPLPAGYQGIEIVRPNILSNPHFLKDIKDDGQRNECIEKFKAYLWKEMQKPDGLVYKTLKRLAQTANDIALICYCKPKACHGDVIKDAILWLRAHPEHLFKSPKEGL